MKKAYVTLLIIFMAMFLLIGCLHQTKPRLEGSYQSERDVNGKFISFVFERQESAYELYIDNRLVDRGRYDEYDEGKYALFGEIRDFDIEIESGNEFKVVIEKINGDEVIELVQVSQIPTRASGNFDDIEDYQNLLEP